MERLQKYLARCGLASRRKTEIFITAGQVKVNGKITTALGTKVSDQDEISVNGKILKPATGFVYYLLNKPKGVICTSSDDLGRVTVLNLVPKNPRVVVCGRLDADSQGLVVLTNDGELCYQITHPSYEHKKEYYIVSTLNTGPSIEERIKQLENGIFLEDGPTSLAKVTKVKRKNKQLEFYLTLKEGRNRQVRRMCSAVGLDVVELIRTRIGRVTLGNLPPGRWRMVKRSEIV